MYENYPARAELARTALPNDPICIFDFEGRSKVDIKKTGGRIYVQDSSTEILCMGALVFLPGKPIPKQFLGFTSSNFERFLSYTEHLSEDDVTPASIESIFEHAIATGCLFVAHNLQFELFVVKKFWPEFYDYIAENSFDTAAMSDALNRPSKLADAAALIGSEKFSGEEMLRLAKPTKKGDFVEIEDEGAFEDYRAMWRYCLQDCAATGDLFFTLPLLSPKDDKLSRITRQLNDHGLKIAKQAAEDAVSIVGVHAAQICDEFESRVGLRVTQSVKLKTYFGLPSTDQATLRDEVARLKNLVKERELTPEEQERLEVIELKRSASTSALNKVKKLVTLANASHDGRVHDHLFFNGTLTGRWAGRGPQTQNFKRGTADNKPFLEFIASRRIEGNPIEFLKNNTRRFIEGPFFTADFSQIEARMVVFLSGQEDLVDVFRRGEDVYVYQASKVLGKPPEEITPEERFLGKQQVLLLGYGAGAAKLKSTLEITYDTWITEEKAVELVRSYRQSNAEVVKFWTTLERMFKKAALEHGVYTHKSGLFKVGYSKYLRSVYFELNNGARMYYFLPAVDWQGIRYFGRKQESGARGLIKTYGGKMTENLASWASREIFGDALIRVVDAGFQPSLLVHDEVVVEAQPDRLEEFKLLMEQSPNYLPGFPLAADAAEIPYFCKT